ncbi:MAG: molybdopterin molybdotransferase MoeA [Candidatus Caldarchaeum sp.]|nr:molybdopterin molybdotransferase MoeA [Candidatus Caldarchaeum sp.]
MYRRVERFNDVWEAQKKLLSFVEPVKQSEEVNVFQAYRRVSAEKIVSPRDLPAFNASHMDGFAVNSRGLQKASPTNPVKLRIVGECLPGRLPTVRVGSEGAARVLTGGFLPEDADAVVPQEHVVREGDWIIVSNPVEKMQYVDERGFDVKAGEELFQSGHVFKASDLALLASLGVKTVRVLRKPKVGIIAVGDELTDRFEEAEAGKILNTHAFTVAKLVEASGAEAKTLGILPDSASAVQEKLVSNAGKMDMILTIAGSSISERDVSSTVASRFEVFVHGLTLQPGRVGGYAVVNGTPVVMLPGLIMSTLNVFMFLAYPCLRRLQSMEPRFYHKRVKARLRKSISFRKYLDFVKVVWVSLTEDDDGLSCLPVFGESSGMSIPARSDGFVVAPPGVSDVPEDAEVWVHLPPDL